MRLALPPMSCKVPTPVDLASAMVAAVGDKPGAIWLEPSHGTGVFVRAISKIGVPKRRLVAVDLDPTAFTSDTLAQVTRRIDFLRWARTTDYRFDRIIGNPPYVAIKQLRPSLRKTASTVEDFDGNPIGSRANMWYAFVVSSIRLLKPGGSLAFVLPSASEFADYTSELRTALKDKFESLEILRCERSMFENVQEGTVVAIARGFGTKPFRFRRRVFSNKDELIAALLQKSKIRGKSCPEPTAHSGIAFGDVARIRLGGVTGDAGYFLMNESRRNELGLPTQAMVPVVSKAKHIKTSIIDRGKWLNLKESDERVWLFSPKDDRAKHSEVKAYLELKTELGGWNRA